MYNRTFIPPRRNWLDVVCSTVLDTVAGTTLALGVVCAVVLVYGTAG